MNWNKKAQLDTGKSPTALWLGATIGVFGLIIGYLVLVGPVLKLYGGLNNTLAEHGNNYSEMEGTVNKIYFTWRFWPLLALGTLVFITLLATIRKDPRSNEQF